MKRFEYKILTDKIFKKSLITEEMLNQLGKQGWDMVNVCVTDDGVKTAYFKREI